MHPLCQQVESVTSSLIVHPGSSQTPPPARSIRRVSRQARPAGRRADEPRTAPVRTPETGWPSTSSSPASRSRPGVRVGAVSIRRQPRRHLKPSARDPRDGKRVARRLTERGAGGLPQREMESARVIASEAPSECDPSRRRPGRALRSANSFVSRGNETCPGVVSSHAGRVREPDAFRVSSVTETDAFSLSEMRPPTREAKPLLEKMESMPRMTDPPR